jgi:phosphatidylglycerol:prolipoprotein diacylglycerol transferase
VLAVVSYDPLVHIGLGPLSISPHGLGIALGFVLGARLMLPEAMRKGIAEDDVYALLVRAAVGSIIGARLAYVVNHVGDYDSVLEVLKVWEGGISLLGGFFGAILLAMPEMRRRGVSFWKQMDAAAPGMALGVVVGRVGDLVVGDHLGKVTDFFLGYRCPPAGVDTASPCVPGTVVHQTALYDLLLTAVLLAALLVLRRRPRYDGFLIMVFGAWYGGQRIFEDFLRDDVRRFGLTGSQITASVTVLVCVAWLLWGRRTPRWGRWDTDRMADPGDGPSGTDAEPGNGGPEPRRGDSPGAHQGVGEPGPAGPSQDEPTMTTPPDQGEE